MDLDAFKGEVSPTIPIGNEDNPIGERDPYDELDDDGDYDYFEDYDYDYEDDDDAFWGV